MSLAVSPYSITTIKRFRHFYEACQLAYLQYRQSGLSDHHPNGLRLSLRDLLPDSATFVALMEDEVVATVTGVRWSPCRLPASSTFSKEIESIVATGSVITEGTKFASRAHEFGFPKEKGKLTVVSEDLLKTVLYWSSLVGASHWINVVHPRHLPYFTAQLGFTILSDSRDCAHVSDHPGVLIGMPTSHCFPTASPHATEYLKNHYLNDDISLSRFQNHYRISSHEAAFLLIECPELLERATEPERLLFDWFYPRIAERVVSLSPRNPSKQNTPSIAPALTSLIDLPSQIHCDNAETFEPVQYLQKLAIVATEIGIAKGKKLAFEINSGLSISCLTAPYDPGQVLSLIISELLATSSLTPNNQLTINATNTPANTTELSFKWETLVETSTLSSKIERWTNGESKLESTGPYTILKLPSLLHAPPSAITILEQLQAATPSRAAILIISNNTLESRILRIMTSQLGYTPLVADSLEEVMSVWKNNHIVSVLVDLASPGTGGFSACRHIRSSGAWGTRVPIIACTGYPLNAVNDACNEAGISACISKPLSLPKLTSLIKELISEHTAPLPLDSESIVTTKT